MPNPSPRAPEFLALLGAWLIAMRGGIGGRMRLRVIWAGAFTLCLAGLAWHVAMSDIVVGCVLVLVFLVETSLGPKDKKKKAFA